MDQKEASAKVAEILARIDALLKEAEQIATDAKIEFSWNGPSYGMGGYFIGSDVGDIDKYGEESTGWLASSQSC